MNNALFQPFEAQAQLLAKHLPDGLFWQNKFNQESNLGKLVLGLAVEFFRLQVLANEFYNEFDINKTNQLLLDWEKSVGIPNTCFTTNLSIQERRDNVLQLFSNFGGAQSNSDFVRIAAYFGFTIKIINGTSAGIFPLSFPILFFNSARDAAHTLLVQVLGAASEDSFFPLPFPLSFSSGGTTFLKCIFEALAPATTKIIITNAL